MLRPFRLEATAQQLFSTCGPLPVAQQIYNRPNTSLHQLALQHDIQATLGG